MKEKWSNTSKGGKLRLIVLMLICLWSAYCVIEYSYEIYNMDYDVGYVDIRTLLPVFPNGSLFTGLIRSFIAGNMVVLGVFLAYILLTAITCLVPQLIYWLIFVSRADVVSAGEAELVMNTCGLGGFISLVGGIAVTLFRSKMPAVLLTLIWLMSSIFTIVVPLRKKISG